MHTKIIGHRGSAGYHPDNSIAGLLHAIEVGADAVEIDVHKTLDGIQVLFHDDSVEGVPIHKLTYLELIYRADPKPILLEHALETIKGKIFCDAEMKLSVGKDVSKVLRTFEQILPHDQYHVKSFEDKILRFLRKKGYSRPIALNLGHENIDLRRYAPEEIVTRIKAIAPYQIHPAREFMFSWVFEALQEVGLPLWVWTVDAPAEVEYFLGLDGISGIITNCLPETLEIRSRLC